MTSMNTPFLPDVLLDHGIGPVRARPAAGNKHGWVEFAARLRACTGVDEARVSAMQQIIVSGLYESDPSTIANGVLESLVLMRRH